MKNIILVLIGLLLLFGVTSSDARVPTIGDYVEVHTLEVHAFGNITDVANGFICINASSVQLAQGNLDPQDICIGIGSITLLDWPKMPKAQRSPRT